MGYLVYEVCEFVYKPCYYATHACCFVHTWSYSVKRLCYYVKKLWSIHHAIMLNICVVLSKQCLIMLKGYVMSRNPVILFMKHVNLSVNVLLC